MVIPIFRSVGALLAGVIFLSSTIPWAAPKLSNPSPAQVSLPPRFQAAMENLYQDFIHGKRDFSFENVEVGGKYLGSIPEIETRLRVQGSGEATLFRRKGPGDTYQFPPGRYTGRISDSIMKVFLDHLRKGPYYNITSDFHGPWEPVSRFYIRTAKESFAFSQGFSTRTSESEAMRETNRILQEWTENACPKPIWSLTLKADQIVFKDRTFSARLRVVNRGVKTVHIVHPGSPDLGTDFGVTLKYAEREEEEEGVTSTPNIKWARLDTRMLRKPQLIIIEPGAAYTMRFSADMEAMPRGWMGKFSFNSHLATDTLLGKQVFNGTLFTEPMSW